MLRSKYFWIAMLILVPFVVVWIMEGFGWAIATLVIMGILFLFILGGTRRRRRYYYYDDDYDEEIIVQRRPRGASSSFNTAMKWHVPKVNKKGVDFIAGPSGSFRKREQDAMRSLRERQERDMRRTKKNLWG